MRPLAHVPLVQGRGGQRGVRQALGTSQAAGGLPLPTGAQVLCGKQPSRPGAAAALCRVCPRPVAVSGREPGVAWEGGVRPSRPVRRGVCLRARGPGHFLQRAGSVDDLLGSSGPGAGWSPLECGSVAAGCVPFVKWGVFYYPDLQWGCCQETRQCPPRSSGWLGGGRARRGDRCPGHQSRRVALRVRWCHVELPGE